MEVEYPWIQSPVPQKKKKKKKKKKKNRSRVWWCTLVIPVLGRLRPEDHRFPASLSYLVRPSPT